MKRPSRSCSDPKSNRKVYAVMAQPHQQYPPRNYSPLPRTDSPHHSPPGPYPPPKRQRLSPNSQSPYSSPSMANIALPNQVFSSPYFGNQGTGAPHNNNYTSNHHYGSPAINPYNTSPTYGSPAGSPYPHNNAYSNMNNAYNTMNAPPQSGPQPAGQSRPTGTMGPPSRPDDKPTDINELEDVLMGSGVDLKEEEAALLNSYRQAGQQRQETGHISNAAGFGQSYSVPRENFYSQNVPGGRNTFYGAGSFNQRPSPYQSTEAMLASDRKQAERRKAAIQSYHLNDSFLFTGSLYRRIVKQAQGMQAKLPPHDSVLQRQSRPDMPPTELTVSGPDKNEVLKVVKGQELLCMNSPYVELLSLLSLAAEERIRGLVEDAATLAKGRRIGSHGVVPADLASLAVGNGTSETVAGLPTPSNSAVSPKSNPLKRMLRLSYCYIRLLIISQVLMQRRTSRSLQSPTTARHLVRRFWSLTLSLKLFKRFREPNELKKKRGLLSVSAVQPLAM